MRMIPQTESGRPFWRLTAHEHPISAPASAKTPVGFNYHSASGWIGSIRPCTGQELLPIRQSHSGVCSPRIRRLEGPVEVELSLAALGRLDQQGYQRLRLETVRRLLVLLVPLAGLLFSAACITIEVNGDSPRIIKKRIEAAPAFQHSGMFFPDGVPEQPDSLPELGRQEVRRIRRTLNDHVKALVDHHSRRCEWLAGQLGLPLTPRLKQRLTVTNTGAPVAEIDEDGNLSVDVKVVQAIFRASLVEGLSERGGRFERSQAEAPQRSETELLSHFMRLKKEIEETPGHTMLGELVFDDDSWFTMTDLSEVLDRVQRRYTGTLLFLLSHELGHIALEHHAVQVADETHFQRLELQADAYGALIVADIFRNPILVEEVMGIRSSEAHELAGYHDFFSYAYERAGFRGKVAGRDYEYPPTTVRMSVAEGAFRIVEEETRAAAAAVWATMAAEMETAFQQLLDTQPTGEDQDVEEQ